ncbi:MAG: Glu/Leu/Phe/Val dehydrogenase [Nitrospiraceae bacterium]|nr:MAG: Glu/Leu/Phe/Val dehydrogenase [Nitrospiraceae bacterium]
MGEIQYDELGPEKILELHSAKAGITAVVVVDNTALGPSLGGVRVSPLVTRQEIMRLARAMTLKNSIAGLPHGGGKAGIIAEPNHPRKEFYFRFFSKQIKHLYEYIPGPDMGSNEEAMAWVYDEIQRAAGLPEELGGIPLDKLGATGFGLSVCAGIAAPYAGINLKGARVAVQGFGSVGKAAARFLSEKGAVLVAASDTGGTIYNPDGIDYRELINLKESSMSVTEYKKGVIKGREDIFSLDVEILIPAAIPDVIHKGNVDSVKARLVLQGANIPVTQEAEEALQKKGILSIPDFIANAGGVIMAAMEYEKKTEKEAFEAIATRIRDNTRRILEKSEKEKILPRQAAVEIAKDRVLKAMRYREY